MIDTISLSYPDGGTLKPACIALLNDPRHGACEGWFITASHKRAPDGRPSKPFYLTHRPTALTVTGADESPAKITVSLPRLFRPDNIQLLRSDEELTTALVKARTIAAEVAEFRPRNEQFSRVDITAYIPVAATTLLPLFEKVKHGRFHRLPVSYPGESLTWGARRGGARLVFYDKAAQQKRGTDARTRIELQLHGKRLCKGFKVVEGDRLRAFTLRQAYGVLREFVQKFPSTTVGPNYDQDTLLAYAISKELTAPDGRHLMDWRNDGVQPDTARKNRARVSGAVFAVTGFDWNTFLPAEPTAGQLMQMT